MARRLIIDDWIADVRSKCDEANSESLDDERDILPALSRAQDYCANIFARHYESPLLTYKSVATVVGTSEYDIPEDALEQRILRIEVNVNGIYTPVTRLDYRDIGRYETTALTQFPEWYCVVGTKFRLVPGIASASFPLRVWYLKDPLPPVKSQGMITSINLASNYVIVDEAGSALTSEGDELDSYVNIVDGQSGVIKGTLQVQSIASTGRITFKTTPSRSSVLNSTILGAIPATVERDDYICLIHGSCVPFIKKPMSNFVIQYATAELQAKNGGDAAFEQSISAKMEKEVERSWAGREVTIRVQPANALWKQRRSRRRIIR